MKNCFKSESENVTSLLTLSLTSPGFLGVCIVSHLKTLLDKEKFLVMSNFFFSQSVFKLFGELFAIFIKLNPLPDHKILHWSKLKQSADDNFEFDVNSRKFSKLVENTVGIGEIALYEQFLLFPQCFQKARFSGASKGVIVWEWVKIVS